MLIFGELFEKFLYNSCPKPDYSKQTNTGIFIFIFRNLTWTSQNQKGILPQSPEDHKVKNFVFFIFSQKKSFVFFVPSMMRKIKLAEGGVGSDGYRIFFYMLKSFPVFVFRRNVKNILPENARLNDHSGRLRVQALVP